RTHSRRSDRDLPRCAAVQRARLVRLAHQARALVESASGTYARTERLVNRLKVKQMAPMLREFKRQAGGMFSRDRHDFTVVEEQNYGGSPKQSGWDERLVGQLRQRRIERLIEQLRERRPERIVGRPRLVGRLARFERLEQSEWVWCWLERQ